MTVNVSIFVVLEFLLDIKEHQEIYNQKKVSIFVVLEFLLDGGQGGRS